MIVAIGYKQINTVVDGTKLGEVERFNYQGHVVILNRELVSKIEE